MYSLSACLSIFNILYLFIILCLCRYVTTGSNNKWEMEAENVSTEAQKSILHWTDGIINRQWLKQMGSSGWFSQEAVRHTGALQKNQKKETHTTTGVHAIPDLTQSTTRSDWPVGRGCLLVSKSCPVHVLHLERKATAVHPCIHCLKSYTPGGCISKCQTVKLK